MCDITGRADCVLINTFQHCSYPPQEWFINKDHAKSKVCVSLGGDKEARVTKGLSYMFLIVQNI